MNDDVFENLEFAGHYFTKINFLGAECNIDLFISGDDSIDPIEDEQRDAHASFMKSWNSKLQEEVLESILEYYKEKREELGYDIEENDDYPPIENCEQLIKHISLESLIVSYDTIGLAFGCTWNEEDGIGVEICDGEVTDVGYQDIVF